MKCRCKVALVFFSMLPAGSAGTLSLADAQALLFENNLEVRIAESRHQKSCLEVVRSRALCYPTVESYGSLGYQSEVTQMRFAGRMPIEIDVAPGMKVKDTIAMNLQQGIGDRDRIELGLNLSYPFFVGMSPYYDVMAREQGVEVQSLALQSLKNRLSLHLGLLYFNWELAVRKVEQQRRLLQDLREYHLHMRTLYEGGVQSHSRVLEARARLERANADLAAAQGSVDSILYELRDFIDVQDSTLLPGVYDLRRLTRSADPAGIYVNPQRTELLAIDHQIEQIELFRKALTGRRMPALFFNLGLRYGNPGLNMNLDRYMSWGVAAIAARWTVYDGRENWAQRTMLRHDHELAELEKRRQERTFARMADQALLQIDKARTLQNATEAACAAAQAYADDLHNGLRAGVTVTVEYLEALNALNNATYALESARTMEKIGFLQLMFARGEEIRF